MQLKKFYKNYGKIWKKSSRKHENEAYFCKILKKYVKFLKSHRRILVEWDLGLENCIRKNFIEFFANCEDNLKKFLRKHENRRYLGKIS